MKTVTIKDVARAAGVSTATVSLTLAGKGNISRETRERILKLVDEMHYTPDWSGKNLKAGKTGIIALYVCSIRGYYSQLADAICGEIEKYGYGLDIVVTNHRDKIMSGILGKRNDGAIILHHAIGEREAQVLLENEVPVVFLDRNRFGRRVSCVLLDSFRTGWQSAEYLYNMGHRDILFVKGSATFDAVSRYEGFCAFMTEHSLPLPRCIEGEFDRYVAYRSMRAFLEAENPLPDALFACNDDSAYGCCNALVEWGIRVPEDVSVLGCDDTELSRWFIPSISTVSTDIDAQGREAARAVIELIDGEPAKRVIVPGKLIERASCIRKIHKNGER